MKPRASLAQTALCALALAVSLLAACGGRYQTIRELEDDPGAPSAGRGGAVPSSAGSSSAGSSNVAGSVGVGGVGSGGAGPCDNVKCGTIACPAGSAPVFAPGACCATSCSSTCPPCGKCPSGTHPENVSGSCCGTCVDDADALCKKGQQAYRAQRDAYLSKYQLGCASDQECVTLAPVNLCEQGCSYQTVWYGAADALDSNLSNAADMYCANCKQGPIPPCVPPPRAICYNGACQFIVK